MKTNQSQKNIPDEWQEIRLGEAVEYVKGFPFKSEDYVSSGIRIIRVSDLGRDYIHNRKMIFIDSKKGYEYSKWKLKEDDLIFTTVGSKPPQYDSLVGRVIRVSKSNEGNLLNQNAVLLRVKNDLKLNQVYIFNHFLTQRYIYFVEGIIRGNANQGSITLEDLFEFTFFIPPFNEQNRIVKILDVWDKAIKNLTTKVEIKKQVRKNLMRSLLSGKIRIDGLGTEWESTKLGNLICNVSARNKALKVFRVLSVTNKHGFVLPEKQFARVVASEDLSNYKIISRGDFAYNPSRINVGSLARLDDYEEGLLSPMYVAFRPNKNIDSDYLYHWLDTAEANGKIRNCSSGSVRESVDFKSFCSIKIKIPKIEEQKEIVKILNASEKEILILEKKLSIIKDQKTYLLNNLITGTIRTPETLSTKLTK